MLLIAETHDSTERSEPAVRDRHRSMPEGHTSHHPSGQMAIWMGWSPTQTAQRCSCRTNPPTTSWLSRIGMRFGGCVPCSRRARAILKTLHRGGASTQGPLLRAGEQREARFWIDVPSDLIRRYTFSAHTRCDVHHFLGDFRKRTWRRVAPCEVSYLRRRRPPDSGE